MSLPAGSQSLSTVRAAGVDFLMRPGDADATVVLLHGIGGRASSFASLMACWPQGPRLLAWDAPGYGRSSPPAGPTPDPAAYAAALAAALDAMQVGACGVAGQSLGALFAGAFASRFPDRAARLALMCPALGYGVAAGAGLPDGLAKRLADHGREGPDAFAASRAARLVHEPARKPAAVAAVRAAMATVSSLAHAPAVHALARGDLLAAASAWRLPVLIVAGADDAITPMEGAQKLFAALRARPRGPGVGEGMHVVGDAGHAVYLEQPAAVAAAMSSFFGASACPGGPA
jgi:pimeloyl-ACP methyl ester carboxylesterase